MITTEVTYGQLDNVLHALGFSCRVAANGPPTRIYEHKETGAWIMLPQMPDRAAVIDYHLAHVRNTLDGFGIADAGVFDATLQKAG